MSKLPVSFPSLEVTDLSRVDRVRMLMQGILDFFRRTANAINNPDFGTTAARPATQLSVGQFYFDTTLGKPIWWKGAVWVDGSGATV